MGKKKPLTKEQLQKLRELLLQRREEFNDNLKTGLEEIESPEGHHLADLEEMDNIQGNDAVFEVLSNASNNLEQIDKALERLENNTYGICEECAAYISLERLKALPFATRCIECKRKEES